MHQHYKHIVRSANDNYIYYKTVHVIKYIYSCILQYIFVDLYDYNNKIVTIPDIYNDSIHII